MKIIGSTIATVLLSLQLAQAAPANFLGNWNNVNRSTRDIVRVLITQNPITHQLIFRGFGACTPTPCDMGTTPLVTYGRSVSDMNHMVGVAHYNFAFKQEDIIVKVSGNSITLETYSRFTDNSGRQNYWTSDRLRKTRLPLQENDTESDEALE